MDDAPASRKRLSHGELEPSPATKRAKTSPNSHKSKKRRRKKQRKLSITTPLRPRNATVPSSQPSGTLQLSSQLSEDSDSSEGEQDDALPTIATLNEGKSNGSTTISSEEETESKLTDQVKKLQKELNSKNELIQAHQSNLEQLQQSLTCQICLELLYKPYAVVSCGHISCLDCLIRWFTTTPTGQRIPREHCIGRAKTCPHCRTKVTHRPIELWNIKEMVSTLSKSGLVVTDNPGNDSAPATDDPWKGIFLTRSYDAVQDMDAALTGIRDDEDGGIYRCIDCLNEIWDGTCSGCRRFYPRHPGEVDMALHHQLLDTEANDSDVDSDDVPYHLPDYGLALHHYLNHDRESDGDLDGSEDWSEEREDEEDYEDSFIDDGDNGSHLDIPMPSPTFPPTNVIELSDDDGDDEPVVRARFRRARQLTDNEDDETTDVPEPPSPIVVGRRRIPVIMDSDSDEDEHLDVLNIPEQFNAGYDSDRDDESSPPPPARLRHLIDDDDSISEGYGRLDEEYRGVDGDNLGEDYDSQDDAESWNGVQGTYHFQGYGESEDELEDGIY